TRGANIFFARENVFVEAGGGLMGNPTAWKGLVEKLRPGRLKALGKNVQAPRAVLLCFDLEAFARPGAAEQIQAAAPHLQQRLRLLPRESEPTRIPGAYEFPREFRKVRNMLVQFLVDIGRPSQLRASPFLRGFYFSGVRAVVTQDVPNAGPLMQQSSQENAG